MPLRDYDNHFIVAFDHTSTQEASHVFIHPELTNCSISVDLTFYRAIADSVEILLFDERYSPKFTKIDLNFKKNDLVNYPGHGLFLNLCKDIIISSIIFWASLQLTIFPDSNQRVSILLMHRYRLNQERIGFYYAHAKTMCSLNPRKVSGSFQAIVSNVFTN